MSEPRLLSPMLDGFVMGEAMSDHNGVRCCPALQQATGEKYMVKIISVPASPVQLAAMLLAGAYENKQAALDYYRELAQDVLQEKGILSDLSRLEGFCSYTAGQLAPKEDGTGYEVYLMGPYKQSVERLLSSNALTHLGAVNMGLDLCTALGVCRRAGYLYVDLKPGNIFLSDQGYRIGDLGFVSLSSLKYAVLPEKYQSEYTPAEVKDAMALLNETVDIYALGLILYQTYNGGKLPQVGPVVPPMYADYEMAEIIMKACAADPAERWQDPAQMGQALVGYLQRNEVNDTPIIPPVEEIITQDEPVEEVEEFLPDRDPEPEELAFLQELTNDETAPSEENTGDLDPTAVSEETSDMLAHADELIDHALPEPPVAPQAIEIPIPAPIPVEPEMQETAEQAPKEPEVQPEEITIPDEPTAPEEIPEEMSDLPVPKKKVPVVKILCGILIALLLGCAAFGSWYYYENVYVQTIDDLIVDGNVDMLTVQVLSSVDEDLLTVICTDSYGNPRTSSVAAGVAVFHDLDPQTRYNIRVEISGSHKLTGMTTASFTTAGQTEILTFNAGIGPQDGSVLLNFTLSGQDSSAWIITYNAGGTDPKEVTFTGHSVCIENLEIGKKYTFTLRAAHDIYLIGKLETQFTASKILFAQNPGIAACGDGNLTVVWSAPEDAYVSSWTVRCYDESGYSKTITTTDTTATFEGLDHSSKCTVEIFAEGMSQSTYLQIPANPINLTAFHFDANHTDGLGVTWDFTGIAPDGGWILSYSLDGSDVRSVICADNSAVLEAIVGGNYTISVRPVDEVLFFGEATSYTLILPAAPEEPEI